MNIQLNVDEATHWLPFQIKIIKEGKFIMTIYPELSDMILLLNRDKERD